MKKIDKVKIENFQSHEDSEINFSEFSIIVGHTDGGKTAIIRAIKWCLYNTPDGTDFIKRGAEQAKVTVYFIDGTSITRCRAKRKVNYYEINYGGQILRLESFGSGPVNEVVDFHGMREVTFLGPKQSLNFCDQLSKPFFVGASSSERASMVGDFAKTSIIDRAIRENAYDLRLQKSLVKSYQLELKEIDEELLGYSKVDDLLNTLDAIKNLMSAIEKSDSTLNKINMIKKSVDDLTAKSNKSINKMNSEKSVSKAMKRLEDTESLMNKASKIKKIAEDMTKNKERVESLSSLIRDEDLARLKCLILKCPTLSIHSGSLVKMKELSKSLDNLAKRIVKLESVLKSQELVTKVNSDFELFEQKTINYSEIFKKVEDLKTFKGRKEDGDRHLKILSNKTQVKANEYKTKLRDSKTCPICFSDTDKDLGCIDDYVGGSV